MPRTIGIPNLTNEDKAVLLKIVKKVLPVVNSDWRVVEKIYNKLQSTRATQNNVPQVNRTAKTLETQFNRLLEKRDPADESAISQLIAKAKEIDKMIQDKIQGVTSGTTEDENNEEDEGRDEIDEEDFKDYEESSIDIDNFSHEPTAAPASSYRQEKSQPSLETAIISLVGVMKDQLTQRQECRHCQPDQEASSSQLEKMAEDIRSLRFMVQFMMDKMGIALPEEEPSSELGRGNKRVKLE